MSQRIWTCFWEKLTIVWLPTVFFMVTNHTASKEQFGRSNLRELHREGLGFWSLWQQGMTDVLGMNHLNFIELAVVCLIFYFDWWKTHSLLLVTSEFFYLGLGQLLVWSAFNSDYHMFQSTVHSWYCKWSIIIWLLQSDEQMSNYWAIFCIGVLSTGQLLLVYRKCMNYIELWHDCHSSRISVHQVLMSQRLKCLSTVWVIWHDKIWKDVLVRIHGTGWYIYRLIQVIFCGKLVGKCTRLQLCLIYIFGSNATDGTKPDQNIGFQGVSLNQGHL